MKNIAELLDLQIKRTMMLKEKRKSNEKKEGVQKQKYEFKKRMAREKKIASLLSRAQSNFGELLEFIEFRKYITHVLQNNGYAHIEYSFMTDNNRNVLITEIASNEKVLGWTQTVIILILPTTDPFLGKIVADIRTVVIEIRTHNHDFRTCSDVWSECKYYCDKDIDDALNALAKPESAIKLLVEKFGGFETKPDEY